MMGRSHTASGWVIGLAVAPVLGLHDFHTAVPFAAATAGFSLLPDLDCRSATASRALGPVTKGISWCLRHFSAWLYSWTKGPRDEPVSGQHRHASHTAIFAGLLGLLAWWGASAGGPWATAAILAVGVLLAVDALGKGGLVDVFVLVLLGSGVVWWATSGVDAGLTSAAGWIGWAVTIGCLVHDVGDSLTVAGCPVLFPVPIGGETWAELKPLMGLSFHTGKRFENLVVFPALVVGAGLMIPGVWPQVVGIAHAFLSDLRV